MKVGSAVIGLHIVAVCAVALLQGCVTSESQGSGRGAGARHKGPWKHQHKGKEINQQQAVAQQNAYPSATEESSPIYEPVIIESASTTPVPEPYVAPVAPPPSSTETYIVQKGDILSKIAARFDTTTKTLVSMNGLANPDVLYVGQKLRVPAGSHSAANSSSYSSSSYSPRSTPAVKKGGSYVIQKGDTLSRIAVAAGVSLNDLRSLNNIVDDKIFAGETISIPSGGRVPAKTQKTTKKPTQKAVPVEPAPAPMAALAPESVGSGSMQVDAIMDHVVYPNETLDDISRQYGVSKSEIMRLNNISDASAVKEGQRLRIPIAE